MRHAIEEGRGARQLLMLELGCLIKCDGDGDHGAQQLSMLELG